MTDLVEGTTRMCSNTHPHELYGTYIGSVLTMKGLTLFIVEKGDGQIFIGTRRTVTILQREDGFTETPREEHHESTRSTFIELRRKT